MPLRACLLVVVLAGGLAARPGTPLEGTVLPFRQVEVSAPVSCRIQEMKVQEGETVKEGQALARLEGRLEELEMQRTKALLERSEFEAKGARRLYENRIIPEAKAVETRIDLELARLRYETATEQVRLRTVLSPLEGIVVRRAHEAGEAVTTGQSLFRILDLSRVRVQVAVEPRNLAAFHPGRKVKVLLPQLGEGVAREGDVSLVDPCADAQGRVRVQVVLPNGDLAIRAGLRALVCVPEDRP